MNLIKQGGYRRRAISHHCHLGDVGYTLSVVIFGDQWTNGDAGIITLCGITDNAGNALAMKMMTTTKFPQGNSVQLQKCRMHLDLRWALRVQVTDALTNLHFAAFANDGVDIENLQILVGALQVGPGDQGCQEGCQGNRREEEALRARQPWG